MRKFLRIFAIEILALYFVNEIATGLVFQRQLEGFIITAIALVLATKLIRPIINILLLPLNLATLGLFKFLSHAITLYLVDFALDEFKVTGFYFPGLVSTYLDLPPISINSQIGAYLAFSLIISIITGIISWLNK